MMGNAVTKVDLHDDGKQVTLHFKRDIRKETTVNIKDIKKVEHEKELVQTFEEATLFPILVADKKYYLNGPG